MLSFVEFFFHEGTAVRTPTEKSYSTRVLQEFGRIHAQD